MQKFVWEYEEKFKKLHFNYDTMRIKCVTNFEKQAELLFDKKCKKSSPSELHTFLVMGKPFPATVSNSDSFRRSIIYTILQQKSVDVELSRYSIYCSLSGKMHFSVDIMLN